MFDKKVLAYTDGAALGNPGQGGYGVVLKYKGEVKELAKGYRHTTNNRMEVLGAIAALETLKVRCRVVLTTDSRYVIDPINKGWAKKWRANDWDDGDRLNADLWAKLLELVEKHDVSFQWVRGHSGHPENERCDALAKEAAESEDLCEDTGYAAPPENDVKKPEKWEPARRVSQEEIQKQTTPDGGFTKQTLAEWGVPWPPPKGWRKRLISFQSPDSNPR